MRGNLLFGDSSSTETWQPFSCLLSGGSTAARWAHRRLLSKSMSS